MLLARKLKTGLRSLRAVGVGIIWSAVQYRVQRPLAEARFAAGSSQPASWTTTVATLLRRTMPHKGPSYQFLGEITAYEWNGQTLALTCGEAAARIDVLDDEIVRVRLAPDGRFRDDFSYAIGRTDWPAVPAELEDMGESLVLHTAALTCRVQKSPCRLSFYNVMGRLLAEDAEGLGWAQAALAASDGAAGPPVTCRQRLLPNAHFYGLGEKAFGLERRGRRFELYNSDPEFYTWYDDPLYQSIPFYLGLIAEETPLTGSLTTRATAAYGLLLDNPARSFFDFGYSQPDMLSFEAECGELRYYFIAATRLQDVLDHYTDLTGRMQLPPLWALGFHQARWSYPTEAAVRQLAAEFRQRRIPLDAVYLDIDYMEGFRCFTWNAQAFPTHRQMIADLKAQGVKTVAIIDAGIKMDPGYHVHDAGMARDVFLKHPDGSLFHGPVWPGDCYFPDFTSPAVRQWWGDLYAGLVEEGVAGFWNDMNEPSIFRQQTMPAVLRHDYDGRGASHREVHNAYGTQMARATAEGLARLRPGQRQLVISRAAFAGHQRHAMVWTGDNYSTWEHLRLTVPMGLSLGLSGLAFNGADVGGFAGDCTGELLVRWTQLGAFSPFFRNHAAMGTVQQEPWAFGPEVEGICRRAIELRYALLPYNYTAFWQASQTGLPIMRPLVLAYQGDPRTAIVDDEYMWGDELVVAPVMAPGQRGRNVYLPPGVWYDFWSSTRMAGNCDVWADAPLDRIPLFVKAGAVLPLQPVIQHTAEPTPEVLSLRVYPGIGESLLYEDDGQSLAYLDGDWRLTRFAIRGDESWVEVTRRSEGRFVSPRRRLRWEVAGLRAAPDSVEVDDEVITGWTFDAASGLLAFETGLCTRVTIRGAA